LVSIGDFFYNRQILHEEAWIPYAPWPSKKYVEFVYCSPLCDNLFEIIWKNLGAATMIDE
jgi:hypothetical protein